MAQLIKKLNRKLNIKNKRPGLNILLKSHLHLGPNIAAKKFYNTFDQNPRAHF